MPEHWSYIELEEYFEEHPDEEAEFIEEMARLHAHGEPIEIPEDWEEKYATAR